MSEWTQPTKTIEQWLAPSLNKHCGVRIMSCTINSVSRSKRVLLPNHSLFSTAGHRLIKDAKNGLRAEKMTFFGFFFFWCTFTHRDATFLFLSKFYIFRRSEISWGGQKALQTNKKQTNKQTNNNERTNKQTPQTIIIARKDSFRILGLIMNHKHGLSLCHFSF